MEIFYLSNSHSSDTDYSDDEGSIPKEINISQKLIEIISSTLQTIIKDKKNPKTNLTKFLIIIESQKYLFTIIYPEYTNIHLLMIVL